MNKKIKLAFVGVGTIFNMHIASAEKNENIEVYAFCDINENTLKEKGKQYNITRLYTSEEKMLEELPEIDAVVVCTYNKFHSTCSIMALNAGKHVFCEKPMAINYEEAVKMQEAARKNNRKLMVGFVRRFGEDCRAVQSFIDGGELGMPYFAKAKYIRSNGFPGGWFGEKEMSGGGPLIDLGVHVIDLIRYVTGNPKPISVYAMTSDKIGPMNDVKRDSSSYTAQTKIDNKMNVEDFATAMIRFDNGMVLSVETSFTLYGEGSAEVRIYGDKGGMYLEPEMKLFKKMNGYLVNITPSPSAKFDFDKSFADEMDYFVQAIIKDYSLDDIASDGVTLMRILTAAYESARTGHEVVLN